MTTLQELTDLLKQLKRASGNPYVKAEIFSDGSGYVSGNESENHIHCSSLQRMEEILLREIHEKSVIPSRK